MGEDRPIPDWELPRCVTVYVTCMLHADKYIRGNHETYNLGHGRTYQMLGPVVCERCITAGHGDKWIKLEFEADPQATVKVPHMEYTMALVADMNTEYGLTEGDEAEEAEAASETCPPSVVAAIKAAAPPLLNRPPLTPGGSHT